MGHESEAVRAQVYALRSTLEKIEEYIVQHKIHPSARYSYTRCATCGDNTFLTVEYYEYRYVEHADLHEIFRTPYLEILDGYCTSCGNDDLYAKLCHLDPSRDQGLIHVTPKVRYKARCPFCEAKTFIGILRGKIWSGGACQTCHGLIASREYQQNIDRRMASVLHQRSVIEAEYRKVLRRAAEIAEPLEAETLPPSSG